MEPAGGVAPLDQHALGAPELRAAAGETLGVGERAQAHTAEPRPRRTAGTRTVAWGFVVLALVLALIVRRAKTAETPARVTRVLA